MKPTKQSGDRSLEIEHFQNYSEYSKTLRAWLVAYGIGGPVVLMTNDKLAEVVGASPLRGPIVWFFLSGVALQIVLAFINKWCAWNMYVGENNARRQHTAMYRFWLALNECSALDLILDSVSIIAFAVATILLAGVFT